MRSARASFIGWSALVVSLLAVQPAEAYTKAARQTLGQTQTPCIESGWSAPSTPVPGFTGTTMWTEYRQVAAPSGPPCPIEVRTYTREDATGVESVDTSPAQPGFEVEAAQLPTRLLTEADLIHQGSFTIPFVQDVNSATANGPQWCEWVNGAIAFNPVNQSLFLVCHDWTQTVAEFRIPALGGVASVLQAPRDAMEGRLTQINPTDTNSKKVGGVWTDGASLVVSAYSFYDGALSASASHFTRAVNLAATGTLRGPFRVGSFNPGFYAGYMTPIPTAWQSALGGDLLTGQCCLSIVSRTSYGPSVSAVAKANLLAAVNPTPATMLVGYDSNHKTLGDWDQTSGTYNDTADVTGIVFPENTATVLFVGKIGIGTFCYGDTNCGSSTKGSHAPPYVPRLWFYNAHDFAAVKAGTKQPWEVVPYRIVTLPNFSEHLVGAAYDPATGRIFLVDRFGDGTKPRVHVYMLSGAPTPPPPPPDTTPPSVQVAASPTTILLGQSIGLTADALDNVGVLGVQFTANDVAVGAEDTTAPYGLTWVPPAVGTYTVRAVARDAAGNTSLPIAGVVVAVNAVPLPTPPPEVCGDGIDNDQDGQIDEGCPAPPPPTDPCVTDPLRVTRVSWPTTNTGRRSLTFDVGTKRWARLEFLWPGTLTVTDTRGCVAIVTR